MLRIAKALAERPSIGRVTLLTNAFGLAKVQDWLLDAPDRTGKLRIAGFEDGYDKGMDDKMNSMLTQANKSTPDMNLLIELNVGVHLMRIIQEERAHYFVVDWYSSGFTKHLRAVAAGYCISMPTSEFLARFLYRHEGDWDHPMYRQAMKAVTQDVRHHPVLIHCLPGMDSDHDVSGPRPANFHPVGIVAVPDGTQRVLGGALDFISQHGPPVIYVAMGTMAQMTDVQLRRLAEGLRAPGEWRVMWSVKADMRAMLPGDLTGDFFVSSWLPQVAILDHPNCAAALLHGGWGSVCEAIACGKPVCALPIFGDHSINAAIISRVGMCKVVGLPRGGCATGHHPLEAFTAEELRADLRLVLGDPSFAAAARHWQAVSKAPPGGPSHAAELVETFAAHSQPSSELEQLCQQNGRDDALAGDECHVTTVGFAASAVVFADNPESLTCVDQPSDDENEAGKEDDIDIDSFPRGVRLEVLLLQSTALLGGSHGVTEWLMRLRVYRDFSRFCAHGPDVISYLETGDVHDFIHATTAVHGALSRRGVPLGLASPALEGEPNRPVGFVRGFLAVADPLHARALQSPSVEDEQQSPSGQDRDSMATLFGDFVSAMRQALQPTWWEAH